MLSELDRRITRKVAHTGLVPAAAKPSLTECYHENTKLTPMAALAYGAAIEAFSKSTTAARLFATPTKIFSLAEQIELERPAASSALERVIGARRSGRVFSGEPVSAQELSRLLHFAYGVTDPRRRFRAVASAGGLYPLEVYVAALNVQGVPAGVYHYSPYAHRLDVVATLERDALVERLQREIWFQDMAVGRAALVFVISAVFRRATVKYADRGYRMILMEAGEVAQNLSLLATEAGLSSCLLGGFLDNSLGGLLEIDGIDEAPLLPIVIGRRVAEDKASGGSW